MNAGPLSWMNSLMLREYVEIKERIPAGAVLLVGNGDFLQAFFGDAVSVARATGVPIFPYVYCGNKTPVLACGVPQAAAEALIMAMNEQGITVVVAKRSE